MNSPLKVFVLTGFHYRRGSELLRVFYNEDILRDYCFHQFEWSWRAGHHWYTWQSVEIEPHVIGRKIGTVFAVYYPESFEVKKVLGVYYSEGDAIRSIRNIKAQTGMYVGIDWKRLEIS